jgi:hypothetical protein
LQSDPWLKENITKIENADLSIMNNTEEFAFWLNAYNIITLKAVCEEQQKNPDWKGNLSLFSKIKFFYINKHVAAGRKLSLYFLENKILRKKFKDPRIHFAINCASISCPFLPNKLFQPSNLDEFLEDLTSDFINNQNSVIFRDNTLRVSRIFKWYKKDFKSKGGVIPFIRQYWKGNEIPDNLKLEYLDYDWQVNYID